MRAYVGVTDGDWFARLSADPALTEVNFWQPGGTRRFAAIEPGELFLFKLHSPRNFVVGGGWFAHSTLLPVSLAWDAFGEANGASSLAEMRARIEHYRRRPADRSDDYQIGCILLEQPFFLPEAHWVPVPSDWQRNIVQGKRYDLTQGLGAELWTSVQEALRRGGAVAADSGAPAEAPRFGSPLATTPRLGQGSFRLMVMDAYERRCTVTGERTLPVLQAAHIRPYAEGGEHRVQNGLLLRSDLHILFDRGYLTISPDDRLEVSRSIHDDFDNGRDYYSLRGRAIRLPTRQDDRPARELLRWHNDAVFRG